MFYYDENGKEKWYYEKGMNAYAYCVANDGRFYIANARNGFQKSSFNDYLFYRLDEIKKHTKTHKGTYLYKIFTRDNDVMWCEGLKDNSFTLVHNDKTIRYYKGADPELLKSLGVNISQTFSPSKTKTKNQKKKPDTASNTNIQNFISIPANFAEKMANSNIEKALALYTLSSKSDTVKNIGAIQYVTSYNGIEPDGCEYASVTKKSLQRNYIYNYRQCGQAIEYLGETGVEELTDEAKEQFKQSAKQFENTCKLQNKARMQLNEFVMKCFKNPLTDSYKIIVLKDGKLISAEMP